MAGIGLINIEAGDLLPVIGLAAAAGGVYWLYRRQQATVASNAAINDAVAAATPSPGTVSDAFTASVLSKLFGTAQDALNPSSPSPPPVTYGPPATTPAPASSLGSGAPGSI